VNSPQFPQGPSSEDEHDPTGIRDLLASLPEPGPMPDDVMRSIQSALAEEQQQRSSDHSNVSPLVASTSTSESSRPERTGTVRWLRPLAAVGAAAAIGIGALAGYQALSGGESAPVANPPASQSEPSAPAGANLQDRVSIHNSGRDYTRTGLATEAAALKRPTGAAAPTQSSDEGSPMTTPEGLVSCMRSMIGLTIPDRISADLGRYEGQPAVIVVVTENGKSKAWVVSRTCRDGKGKIAGPTAVT
jgi:hypothetical protein